MNVQNIKTLIKSFPKIIIELPYDPAIPSNIFIYKVINKIISIIVYTSTLFFSNTIELKQ